MNPDTLQTAKEVFAWGKAKLPKTCELEVYVSRGRGRSIVWSEGKCEDTADAEGGGAGLRVILHEKPDSGKQGFAFTTNLAKANVEKTAETALASARVLPEDEFRKLPKPGAASERALNLYDSQTFSENLPRVAERLHAGESALLKKYPDLKSILRAGFSEGASDVAIVNSNGIETSFSGTHSGLGVSCLAEKNGERQEGGYGQSSRFQKDLDWEKMFENAAQRTLALLGGKKIKSGKIPVVFDPTVACEFLSLIAGMVCADSVQKGKSPFKGKLASPIASPQVTVVDDGTLEKGLSTSPLDDEGFPTQKTIVIEKGVLRHFLYDTYTAMKDKVSSTGNAGRAGFKSSPASGTTNFFLERGKTSREKILKETRGLYLYEVMGLHMADPISGDFSVAGIGAWLENGEFKHGVRGITLAGNLLEVLQNIDCVGDDLTFFGSTGSPTFRVSEITVSGS